jgi:hypothetical protein
MTVSIPPSNRNTRASKGGHDGGSDWIARDSLPGDKVDLKTGATDAIDPARMASSEKIKLIGGDCVGRPALPGRTSSETGLMRHLTPSAGTDISIHSAE